VLRALAIAFRSDTQQRRTSIKVVQPTPPYISAALGKVVHC
jgi:hypothetical protein